MIFGLKGIKVEEIILLDDDSETPMSMIGQKMLPILLKDDGSYMPESLDIVHYVDQLNTPQYAIGEISPEITNWFKTASPVVGKLAAPRFVETDFPEISTTQSKNAYRQRLESSYGNLATLRKETHILLVELEPQMAWLDTWLEGRENTINIDDFIVFPVLRSLSIVAEFAFSTNIQNYMERLAKRAHVNLLFDQAN